MGFLLPLAAKRREHFDWLPGEFKELLKNRVNDFVQYRPALCKDWAKMGISGLEVKPKMAQSTERQPAEAKEGNFNREWPKIGFSGLEAKPKTTQPAERQPAEVKHREGEFNRDRSKIGVSGLGAKPKTTQPTKKQLAKVTYKIGEFPRDRSGVSGLEAKPKTTQPTKKQLAEAKVTYRIGSKPKTTQPTEKQPARAKVTRRKKKSKPDSKLQPGRAVFIRIEVKHNWEWYTSGLRVKPKTTQPTNRRPELPTIARREGKINQGTKGMIKDQLDLMEFAKAHPRGLDFKYRNRRK